MNITVTNPKGTLPVFSPKQLPQQYAQTAQNCDFREGRLSPLKALSVEEALTSESKSIFKAGGTWLSNAGIVDYAWASVFDDDGRLYFTGDSYPKQRTNAGVVSRLGVPAPSTALTISLQGTASDGASVKTTTVYVYTYVNALGQEGAFSPPSPAVEIKEGQHTRLTGFASVSLTGFTPDKIRIYRSSTGGTAGVVPYKLVDEVDYATQIDTHYDDEKEMSELGYTAETEYFDMPEDNIEGLISTPNGLLFAHKDNEVHICEPFIAYAWPSAYKKTTESTVMGIGYFDGNVVVVTQTRPYILSGYNPAMMDFRPLPFNQPCVSKKSVVSIPGGVVYASSMGLYTISGQGSDLITKKVVLPEQWETYTPENIIAVNYRGIYLAFFEGTSEGFMFNPNDPYLSWIDVGDITVNGLHYSPADDSVFVSGTDGLNNNIYEWEGAATYKTYTWKSKEFYNPKLTNMGAARIVGDYSGSREAEFKFYGDGNLLFTHTADDSEGFRLPAGTRYRTIEYEVSGTADIDVVYIGTSVEALNG